MDVRVNRFFGLIVKYAAPLVLALLIYVPVHDAIHRWPTAAEALGKYPNQTAIFLKGTIKSVGGEWTRSASYILLPSFREVKVVAGSNAPAEIREGSPFLDVLTVLLYFSVMIWLTARYWIAHISRPPNNRWRGP
jgi:hypothetical protein